MNQPRRQFPILRQFPLPEIRLKLEIHNSPRQRKILLAKQLANQPANLVIRLPRSRR